MNLRILLLTALLPAIAHAGPRTSASANYKVATDTADAGGKRATSAAYTNDGSAGGIAGLSTARGEWQAASSLIQTVPFL